MLKFLSNIPIFRRLFIAFFIAAVIPAVVIALLSSFYLSSLTTRGQAVQTSFDAQSIAAQQEQNLQRMNALLQTRFNQIFASLSGRITDPSLAHAGGLIGSDITAREADFGLSLQNYESNFALASSPNMSTVRSILLNDAPATGSGIISDQQQALMGVVNDSWPAYLSLQKQETTILDSLDPTLHSNSVALTDAQLAANYRQAYPILWNANLHFTDLQNGWQRVVNDKESRPTGL